ncbi:MAG: SGNH/GDSL hydrolase family protein [Planctomycetes bacterium]|nr:SGNH/GDSL hydrolase family protein [Planctomycetota bacterium]
MADSRVPLFLPAVSSMRSTTHSIPLACALFLACLLGDNVRAQGHLPDANRIVFLGDSITHSGGYIVSLESAVLAQHPERHMEFLNLGLPSETVSGLSEPGHAGGQFPRPDLHERLQRVLEQTRPDLVVACYGMNDGIYYPLSEERFAKFKSGIERLHELVEKSGSQILHLTPAFFDALPLRDRLLPAGLEEYRQPYQGYDDVLEAYSEWLLSKKKDGWIVLDTHAAMKQAVLLKRQSNPQFTFAGDGVHPDAAGQAVIAEPLATAWGLSLDEKGLPPHPQSQSVFDTISKKQNTLKLAWLSATRHTRPGIGPGLPIDQARTQAAELDRKARDLLAEKIK